MPCFFFDIYDASETLDEEGQICSSVEEAVQEAYRCARALAAEDVLGGRLNLKHRIEVTDGAGFVVATITFRDAVTVEDKVEPASSPISSPRRESEGAMRGKRIPSGR